MKSNVVYENGGSVGIIREDAEIVSSPKPGFYTIKEISGFFNSSMRLTYSTDISIPSFEILDEQLFNEIYCYFSNNVMNLAKTIGFIHKAGVLLYGKQGCGKTTFCYQLADKFIKERDAVCFIVGNISQYVFVQETALRFRNETSFNAPIIIIVDECERLLKENEDTMKSYLDSATSLDNCLQLFTTNYEWKIPDAIKNRPSRIKHFIEFKGEDDELRAYRIIVGMNDKLDEAEKLPDAVIRDIISNSSERTVDEIKHAYFDKLIHFNKEVNINQLIGA